MNIKAALIFIVIAATGFAQQPGMEKQEQCVRIFRTSFSVEGIKADVKEQFIGALFHLERRGDATEALAEVDRLATAIAEDLCADQKLKDGFIFEHEQAFTLAELKAYADWSESDVARKVQSFNRKFSYLVGEAFERATKGRMQKIAQVIDDAQKKANQTPEPTPMPVTPPAAQEPRQP